MTADEARAIYSGWFNRVLNFREQCWGSCGWCQDAFKDNLDTDNELSEWYDQNYNQGGKNGR